MPARGSSPAFRMVADMNGPPDRLATTSAPALNVVQGSVFQAVLDAEVSALGLNWRQYSFPQLGPLLSGDLTHRQGPIDPQVLDCAVFGIHYNNPLAQRMAALSVRADPGGVQLHSAGDCHMRLTDLADSDRIRMMLGHSRNRSQRLECIRLVLVRRQHPPLSFCIHSLPAGS